jgi:hypothetical protein
MASKIALSSTESEYTGASVALREAIPVMELLQERRVMKVPIHDFTARVHCKLYEEQWGIRDTSTQKVRASNQTHW